MMQAAETRHGNDFRTHGTFHRCIATRRSLLPQPEMRPVVVVVADVLGHEPFQMAFIEHDHMVEQIAAAVADEALSDAVLPRTLEAGSLRFDAEALDCIDDFFIEARAAIEDQVLGCGIVGKRFAQLLDHPRTGRMLGHVAMKNSPPVMRDDEEAIEHAESQRRHGEEIHRSDGLAMIGQECRPSLRRLRIPGRFSHPAQHRSLRDVEAKHLQLAMNPWRSPGSVLGHHAEDEFAQFLAHASPSGTVSMPGEPCPIELEAGSMPTGHSLGLNEDRELSAIAARAAAARPRRIDRHWRIAAAGDVAREPTAVAATPDFPKAGVDESYRDCESRTAKSFNNRAMSRLYQTSRNQSPSPLNY